MTFDIGSLLIGVNIGLVLAFIAMVLAAKAAKRSLEKEGKALDQQIKDKKSVNERLSKVKEITTQQLALQAQITMPQKNSLDGKYKNRLMNEVKTLEEEKVQILNSILQDGHDPEVNVLGDDGEPQRMKLSEFLEIQGTKMPLPKEEPKTKMVGKFTVLKGGKGETPSDDGNTDKPN